MSVFLDISNVRNNIDKQKYQYFDEFDRFIEINKEFVNNSSTDSHVLKPPAPATYHIESLDNTPINQGDAFNLAENSNSVKSAKIGNFNIFNRCVFFINNSNENGNLENQISIHTKSNKERNIIKETTDNQFISYQTRNPILQSHSYIGKNITNYIPDKYQPHSSFYVERAYHNKNNNAVVEQQNSKLFYLHNETLRPVLSANIKSGIYKRILHSENIENVSANIVKNVYFSSSERTGKILTAKQFHNNYLKDDHQSKKGVKVQSKKHFEELTSNFSSDNIHYKSQEKTSTEESGFEDNLSFFGCNVLDSTKEDNFNINRKADEVIYDGDELKRKTIFKVIHPNLLGLEIPNSVKCDLRTSKSVEQNKSSEASFVSKTSSRNRQKKVVQQNSEVNDVQPNNPIITSTTRYGRISKPPQYIQTVFQLTSNEEILKESNFERDNDDDFKYTKEIFPSPIHVPIAKIKRERNLASNSQCNYCHKLYLGRRMQRHLQANPDHDTDINSKEEELINKLSLYKFLVKKIKQSSEDHRAEIFLSEISDLVDQLQSRGSRFVRNTSGVHFVNSQSSKVLGIPEGHYSIDVNAIDSTPETEIIPNESRMIIPPPPPRLDYNLSISLDDTISDAKLNLPDNIVSSEESLLRTVNDLVEQGIGNLREHDDVINHVQTPVMHYDHASDNAVEASTIKTEQAAPILDLSLDLFQFTSN